MTCNCHKTQPVMSIALATFSRCRHLGAAVNGAPKCTSKQAEPICHHLIQNHRPTYCTLVCLWFAIANPHFDLCALHVKAIVINICCGTRGFKLRDPICLHPDISRSPNHLSDQSINSLISHDQSTLSLNIGWGVLAIQRPSRTTRWHGALEFQTK